MTFQLVDSLGFWCSGHRCRIWRRLAVLACVGWPGSPTTGRVHPEKAHQGAPSQHACVETQNQ